MAAKIGSPTSVTIPATQTALGYLDKLQALLLGILANPHDADFKEVIKTLEEMADPWLKERIPQLKVLIDWVDPPKVEPLARLFLAHAVGLLGLKGEAAANAEKAIQSLQDPWDEFQEEALFCGLHHDEPVHPIPPKWSRIFAGMQFRDPNIQNECAMEMVRWLMVSTSLGKYVPFIQRAFGLVSQNDPSPQHQMEIENFSKELLPFMTKATPPRLVAPTPKIDDHILSKRLQMLKQAGQNPQNKQAANEATITAVMHYFQSIGAPCPTLGKLSKLPFRDVSAEALRWHLMGIISEIGQNRLEAFAQVVQAFSLCPGDFDEMSCQILHYCYVVDSKITSARAASITWVPLAMKHPMNDPAYRENVIHAMGRAPQQSPSPLPLELTVPVDQAVKDARTLFSQGQERENEGFTAVLKALHAIEKMEKDEALVHLREIVEIYKSLRLNMSKEGVSQIPALTQPLSGPIQDLLAGFALQRLERLEEAFARYQKIIEAPQSSTISGMVHFAIRMALRCHFFLRYGKPEKIINRYGLYPLLHWEPIIRNHRLLDPAHRAALFFEFAKHWLTLAQEEQNRNRWFCHSKMRELLDEAATIPHPDAELKQRIRTFYRERHMTPPAMLGEEENIDPNPHPPEVETRTYEIPFKLPSPQDLSSRHEELALLRILDEPEDD
jgi:hypothetical protein